MRRALYCATATIVATMMHGGCGDDGSPADGDGSTSGDSTGTTDPGTTSPGTTSPGTSTSTGSTTQVDTGSSTDTGSGSGSTGTGTPDMDVTLQFAARVGEQDAACGQSYDGIGSTDATITFRDLRFYVSNIRLVDDTDQEIELALEQDGTWQHENVALLDFEDGTDDCSEGTTDETRDVVVGTVPEGTYTGIRFDLGVPFALNHDDVALAPPPLNDPALFWVWAAGYKFLRIDLTNDNTPPDNAWNIHLGSQGCMSDGPTDPPDNACSRPGRPAIALDGFDPANDVIVADIAALLDGIDVNANTENSPPGCQSFMPDVDECTDLFPHFGLSWESGDCENGCADQTFFSVE